MSPHVTGDARKRAERTEQPTPPALRLFGVAGGKDGGAFEIQALTPSGRIRRVDMTRKQAFEVLSMLALWLGRTDEDGTP